MTNEEKYLAKIAGENVETPEPVLRKEQYLNYIANESGEIPELPVTREERYLAILAGQEYEIPAPELRIEHYMARACGAEIEVPTPITRVEQYWAEIAENMNNTEITGTLPLAFTSRVAGALKNYRVYGTAEGAGIASESGEPEGYKIPLTITSGNPNLVSDIIGNASINSSGKLTTNNTLNSAVTPIKQGKTYTILYARGASTSNMICGFFNNYPELNASTYNGSRFVWNGDYRTFTAPITGYLVSSCSLAVTDPIVYEGEYQPRTSTTNFLYIGSNKLMENEYIDFAEQMIYKNPFLKWKCTFYISTSPSGIDYIHFALNWTAIGDIRIYKMGRMYLHNIVVDPLTETTPDVIIEESTSESGWDHGGTGANCKADTGSSIRGYVEYNGIKYYTPTFNFTTDYVAENEPVEVKFYSYLNEDAPPTPFLPITAYKGENTLSNTETVGDVTIKGNIKETGDG